MKARQGDQPLGPVDQPALDLLFDLHVPAELDPAPLAEGDQRLGLRAQSQLERAVFLGADQHGRVRPRMVLLQADAHAVHQRVDRGDVLDQLGGEPGRGAFVLEDLGAVRVFSQATRKIRPIASFPSFIWQRTLSAWMTAT